MSTSIYELKNNQFLGLNILEIVAFPGIEIYGNQHEDNCKRNGEAFLKILVELHKLSNRNTVFEFLWLTEKVDNQVFKSQIHIYFILRKIGSKKEHVRYELDNIQKDINQSLHSLQYNLKEINVNESGFQKILQELDDSCVFSIGKKEKCIAGSKSIYPYYFCDVIPNDNYSNFNNLIYMLGQNEGCGISFQLFPTDFTKEEIYMISELSSELTRITEGIQIYYQQYKDILALEPLKVYSYYNERKISPIFQYNILVFGARGDCAALATKMISFLQSGEKRITTADFVCIDLCKEHINIKKYLPNYPWNVNQTLLFKYRDTKGMSKVPFAQKLFRLSNIVSVEEAASFFRLPLYENNMASLKNNFMIQVQEQFANEIVNGDNIKMGRLALTGETDVTLGCPENVFTKHALIVGTPGSGKTTFALNLLLQFAERGIPFLAIEPTKTEYRAMLDRIPELQIFTPGKNDVSPFIINPFIPPKGIKVEQYRYSLLSAFQAAFSMLPPLDMIFFKAIRECYAEFGWKDYSQYGDKDVTVFGLYEFILVFKKIIAQMKYSGEVKGNIESAGLLRLTNLLEQNSNIYDSIHTVPIEDLLKKPTVLELNFIDNIEQKALLMALILINICLYTKNHSSADSNLKNIVLIDEAHVLLGAQSGQTGEADAGTMTVQALQSMVAEIRSLGTGIIIADQMPTKISREIIANTDIKISFRLVQATEKALIADSTNMDETKTENLSRLKPGEAYIYFHKLDTPQNIITEDIREREHIKLTISDTDIVSRMTYWDRNKALLKPYRNVHFAFIVKMDVILLFVQMRII